MYIANRFFSHFSPYTPHEVNNVQEKTQPNRYGTVSNWLLNAAAVAAMPLTFTLTVAEKYPTASMLLLLMTQMGKAAATSVAQFDHASKEISSSSLHSKSVQTVADAIQNGVDKFTTIASFRDKSCANEAKPIIFKTHDIPQGKIKWERCIGDETQCAMIANLDTLEFTRAIGHSAIEKTGCVTSVSIDPIGLPETQQSIHRQSVKRNFISKVDSKAQQESCVAKSTYKDTILSSSGEKIDIYREVYCRPTTTLYERPSAEIVSSYLGKLADTLCIKRLAVISDGITAADVKDSVLTVSDVIKGINTKNSSSLADVALDSSASALARSALKRCHNLKFDDVRAVQNITTSQTGVSHQTQVLSVSAIIEALSQVLDHEVGALPNAVTILDIHEVGNYHPDAYIVKSLVRKLTELNVEVFTFQSSFGSWLSHIPGVKVAKEISEIVTKPVRLTRVASSLSGEAIKADTNDNMNEPVTLWDGIIQTGAIQFGMVAFATTMVGIALICYCDKKVTKPREVIFGEEMIPMNNME